MKIFLSDKLVDEKDAVVSVFDHGLLYGDGVFEGIRAYKGRVFLLDEHIDRLWGRCATRLSASSRSRLCTARRACTHGGEFRL